MALTGRFHLLLEHFPITLVLIAAVASAGHFGVVLVRGVDGLRRYGWRSV
jgi:hypothetical protein